MTAISNRFIIPPRFWDRLACLPEVVKDDLPAGQDDYSGQDEDA
jgi:hypothetical protein